MFCLEKIENEYSWAWFDQAMLDASCWAAHNEATWQEEIEALLLIQDFCLKALSLGLRVWELL